MTDFAQLLEALHAGEVEFIVIGGFAGTIHGSTQVTIDLDAVYRRSPGNIARIVAALERFGPYLRGAPPGLPFRFDVETVERGLNFTLRTSAGDLDLLGEVTGGGGYEDLLPHSEKRSVFDRETLVVSLEMLIRLKRAAGRPRDLQRVAELEAVLEERESRDS